MPALLKYAYYCNIYMAINNYRVESTFIIVVHGGAYCETLISKLKLTLTLSILSLYPLVFVINLLPVTATQQKKLLHFLL